MSKVSIEIHYCPGCKWLLRASWMGQELLSSFEQDIEALSLHPSGKGVFQIFVEDELIWCRKRDEGFPDIKTLKQRVRDRCAPGRDLGHIDNS